MPEPKTYAPMLRSKKREFQSGGYAINISFKAEEFAAWVKEHAKDGYINLQLSPRKNASDKNEFSLSLDTWQPSGDRKPQPKREMNGDFDDVANNFPRGKQPPF